jgi:hypothetical protein
MGNSDLEKQEDFWAPTVTPKQSQGPLIAIPLKPLMTQWRNIEALGDV